jgi:amyloid beta precursor protein binding protein 1
MTKLLSEWGASFPVKDDFIHEICRYGASEIPSVAAFVGKPFVK